MDSILSTINQTMKRQGNLFAQIVEIDNLQYAYLKAKRGKNANTAVYSYSKNINNNLKRLQQELITGDIETGNYHFFNIYDPKKRQIVAAPFHQRVMHHALMNICHQRFEKVQINDSYASRLGKGTYAALETAQENCRKYTWFLKLDVRKYFDNLDHSVLKCQLRALFKDKRLLGIIDCIIDSYHTSEKRGVPIGNLTSQYLANHYLACADHFIKETLRIPGYVRYMDDMVLWHDDKEVLKDAGKQLKKYLADTLHLQLKPFCLNRNLKGLPFIGYLIYPSEIRLTHRSKHRFINTFRLYCEKLDSLEWSPKEYQNHILPLIAFVEHANTLGLRRKIILEME